MINMEAQYLSRYKIKYFSDLINLEEVWKQIDVVVIPNAPEEIETDEETRMTEAEWTNTVYQIIAVAEAEVAKILNSTNKVMCTAVVKDLVDTTKKFSMCQSIKTNLEELKNSIQQLIKEKAEIDAVIKQKVVEEEAEKLQMKKWFTEINKMLCTLANAQDKIRVEVKQKEEAIKSLANKKVFISNKDIELQHV